MRTLLDVYIYCPDVRKFRDSSPEARILAMNKAIDEAGTRKCDIFLGPEFFFTHHSEQLGSEDPSCIMYKGSEAYFVTQKIAAKSRDYPNMLIVMGTCYEAAVGREPQYVYNNAYVYQNGDC